VDSGRPGVWIHAEGDDVSGRPKPAIAALLALAAIASGCTPPQAVRQILYAEEPINQPPLLLVYDFSVHPDDVVVDAFGPAFLPAPTKHAEPPNREQRVANTLAAAMVEKLRAGGIRAERAGARTTPPREAILVKGQFVTVNGDGSAPRMAIGLGSDASMLRVQVQAYRVTESGDLRRIAEREVGGEGIVVEPSPGQPRPPARPATPALIAGGLTFVLRSQANVEADTERLAELFAERAIEFYRHQGWL
jgi:hypothetical protein